MGFNYPEVRITYHVASLVMLRYDIASHKRRAPSANCKISSAAPLYPRNLQTQSTSPRNTPRWRAYRGRYCHDVRIRGEKAQRPREGSVSWRLESQCEEVSRNSAVVFMQKVDDTLHRVRSTESMDISHDILNMRHRRTKGNASPII